MYVDPRGQASANQTGIHDDKVIPGLRATTDAVHEAGGRIFAQIGHCGSQTMMSRITPVAPSPVPNAMYTIQPEELSDAEIRALVRAFGEGARRVAEAGFDGIHIPRRQRLPHLGVLLAARQHPRRRMGRRRRAPEPLHGGGLRRRPGRGG